MNYSAAPSERILLVEDTRLFALMISSAITERLGLDVVVATTLAAARQYLDSGERYLLCLADLVLPDASHVEVAEFFASRGVPTVVFTGTFDTTTRSRILGLRVIDYVLKNSPGALDYLLWLIERIRRNRGISALVVDDSATMRNGTADLLTLMGFTVYQASDGEAGLAALAAHPEIRLVLTGYDMPNLNGVGMVRRMRASHSRERLAIIGMSDSGDDSVPASFLKLGANDFMRKPYLREEFLIRVSQNLDVVEQIAALRDMATRDFLTGLYNRRAFFETVGRLQRDQRHLTVGLFDVDHFKKVNDTLGHDAGDIVLKAVSNALAESARPGDIVARMGGEEFCLLAVDLEPDAVAATFERCRAAIEALVVIVEGEKVPVTISAGIAEAPRDRAIDIGQLLNTADLMLYRAKHGGRNRVVIG